MVKRDRGPPEKSSFETGGTAFADKRGFIAGNCFGGGFSFALSVETFLSEPSAPEPLVPPPELFALLPEILEEFVPDSFNGSSFSAAGLSFDKSLL
jgi:hypothetical protein